MAKASSECQPLPGGAGTQPTVNPAGRNCIAFPVLVIHLRDVSKILARLLTLENRKMEARRASEGRAAGGASFTASAPSLCVTVTRTLAPLDFQELDCGQLPREERLARSPLPFPLSLQLPKVTTSGVLLGLASLQVPDFLSPFLKLLGLLRIFQKHHRGTTGGGRG